MSVTLTAHRLADEDDKLDLYLMINEGVYQRFKEDSISFFCSQLNVIKQGCQRVFRLGTKKYFFRSQKRAKF